MGASPSRVAAQPTASINVREAKAALRAAIRQRFQGLSARDRGIASKRACQLLEQQAVWSQACCILSYAPLADELDVAPLIESALREGKCVALPQFDPQTQSYRACQVTSPIDQMPVGRFGIREPGKDSPKVPMNQLDLILVPGVAFDLNGCRLGRGRGYYDRLLTGLSAVKCGLAFDEQVQAQIPVEEHDILLNCIVTPTRWLDVRQRRLGDDVLG